MPARALIRKQDYPPFKVLHALAREFDLRRPNGAALVLDRCPTSSDPASPASPCRRVILKEEGSYPFVLSQARNDGAGYLTVTGKREARNDIGKKKTRSRQPWPRTPKTDGLRPVSLHRWICLYMHKEPFSESFDAAHTCNNSDCIAGAHLMWQERSINRQKL